MFPKSCANKKNNLFYTAADYFLILFLHLLSCVLETRNSLLIFRQLCIKRRRKSQRETFILDSVASQWHKKLRYLLRAELRQMKAASSLGRTSFGIFCKHNFLEISSCLAFFPSFFSFRRIAASHLLCILTMACKVSRKFERKVIDL